MVGMSRACACSSKGVAAANHSAVAETAVKILVDGGNVVDAAVAASFVMGVVEPVTSGLGGGGFMIIGLFETGEVTFIDYRETAPGKAKPDMYELLPDSEVKEKANAIGHRAAAIPGTMAGLSLALEMYGTMSLQDVMQPAIRYAEKGFEVSLFLSDITKKNWDDSLVKIDRFPLLAMALLKNGRPYDPGEKMIRRDLAKTYKKIARDGPETFYKGEIARLIAEDMEKNGGLITEEDMARYEAKIRRPVTGTYRGHKIVSSPPPSSGGTHVIQILNVVENFDMKELGHITPTAIHVLSEAIVHAYADRSKFMGDPDFATIPLGGLISKDYAREIAEQIDPGRRAEKILPGDLGRFESGETAVFAVMDGGGNAVILSDTVECFLGSGVVVPGTGILLNDEMHDFDPFIGTVQSIEPYKRPLSCMSPTLILKDEKPFIGIGITGGARIISFTVQLILNLIDYGLDLQEAINAARFCPRRWRYSQEKGVDIYVEHGIPEKVREALREMGYRIKEEPAILFGASAGVLYDGKTGKLYGGADPRRNYAISRY